MKTIPEIFQRTELLLGSEVMERMAQRRIILFGTGGVGSWCAEAEVTALQQVFSEETAADFHLDDYDYIIDAIDSLKDKAALILAACQTKAKLFASMGAALKLDPTHIRTAEFWKVEGDPLARALRKKFKHWQRFPEKKFMCVYSDELLPNVGSQPVSNEPQLFNKPQTNGSLVHITAIFGFTLAGMIISDLNSQTSIMDNHINT